MKNLDTTLRQLTGYQLQRTNGAAMLRYKAVFAEFGLRRTTFSCLSIIIDNPGLRQGLLGEALAIERPNLVQIVEDLSNAGLIKREKSKTDGRAHALVPTPQGKALFERALTAIRDLDAHMTQEMSEAEVAALVSALFKIECNSGR